MSWSVVPRRAATLASIPFTLIGAGLASALDEAVSIAKTDAPWGLPTKRIPSGPKASAPADFRSGLPFCNPLVTSAAWSSPALRAAVNSTVKDKRIALGIVRSFRKKGKKPCGERQRWQREPPLCYARESGRNKSRDEVAVRTGSLPESAGKVAGGS